MPRPTTGSVQRHGTGLESRSFGWWRRRVLFGKCTRSGTHFCYSAQPLSGACLIRPTAGQARDNLGVAPRRDLVKCSNYSVQITSHLEHARCRFTALSFMRTASVARHVGSAARQGLRAAPMYMHMLYSASARICPTNTQERHPTQREARRQNRSSCSSASRRGVRVGREKERFIARGRGSGYEGRRGNGAEAGG